MRAFVVPLLFLVGCSQNAAAPSTLKPFQGTLPIKALCTTGMVGDLVRQVGGPDVVVTDLFQAGVDPHTYRASPEDLRRLQSADIVIYNGLHLEGKMASVLERRGQKTPTVGVGDALASLPLPQKPGSREAIYEKGWLLRDGEHSDPHIWFDVLLWSKMVDVVAEKLAEFDPPRAEGYRRRAAAYRERLTKLDAEIEAQIAEIPKEKRVLVTSHDAFRYFGRAYDIDVRGIQGVSTETEASVAHITELVNYLTKAKVKAVFVESSVSSRNMKALIEGCQARGHAVREGGELFSDAMGNPGTPEGTYEGMIRHNVKTVVDALR